MIMIMLFCECLCETHNVEALDVDDVEVEVIDVEVVDGVDGVNGVDVVGIPFCVQVSSTTN